MLELDDPDTAAGIAALFADIKRIQTAFGRSAHPVLKSPDAALLLVQGADSSSAAGHRCDVAAFSGDRALANPA